MKVKVIVYSCTRVDDRWHAVSLQCLVRATVARVWNAELGAESKSAASTSPFCLHLSLSIALLSNPFLGERFKTCIQHPPLYRSNLV